MARRPRRKREPFAASTWNADPAAQPDTKAPTHQEEIEKAFCKIINDWAAAQAMICVLPAPMTLPVIRMEDGAFRTAAINAETEMFFRSVRFGAKKQVIFAFEPIDASYKQVDIDETKIANLFPGLESKISNVLTGSSSDSFSKAKIATLERLSDELRQEAIAKAQEEIRAKEREENEQRQAYNNNPNWGLF